MKTFEDFLQAEHFKEYHGCKDDYDDAFDNWLGNLDTNEMLEYGEKAILEAQKEAIKAVKLKKIKGNPKAGFEKKFGETTLGNIEKIANDNFDNGYNQAYQEVETKLKNFLTLNNI